jgi:transketolase
VDGVYKGAYTISDSPEKPQVILVSSGTEVAICAAATAELKDLKVRHERKVFNYY